MQHVTCVLVGAAGDLFDDDVLYDCCNEDNNNIDSVVEDDDNYDNCNAVPGSGARSNYCSASLVHVGATSSVHKLFGWLVHKKALSCIMMWSRLVKLL